MAVVADLIWSEPGGGSRRCPPGRSFPALWVPDRLGGMTGTPRGCRIFPPGAADTVGVDRPPGPLMLVVAAVIAATSWGLAGGVGCRWVHHHRHHRGGRIHRRLRDVSQRILRL